MADKVKMTLPTPKPAFVPGKPGKATRKEPAFNIKDAIKRIQESERGPVSSEALEFLNKI